MDSANQLLIKKIIETLPYGEGFRFVDDISSIDENSITGHFTFSGEEEFYKSHFLHKPETPGVILIEMIGQIGMVCHLIYLSRIYEKNVKFRPLLSNVEASFFMQVKAGEKLTVNSEKIYFRNDILKSNLTLLNSKGETCVLCKAQLQLVTDL